jgi:hypothetical protein
MNGMQMDMMTKGAMLIRIYLFLSIFSCVKTNPPHGFMPKNVFSDFKKFGIRIRWMISWKIMIR